MSDKFEWVHATQGPDRVDRGFRDAHGSRVDPGNVGIFIGRAVVEGTPAELRTFIARLTALVDKADPSGRYVTHPTSTLLPQVEPIDSWPNVKYEAWTDGYAVGYKATHADGRVEYIYLNPSADDGGDDDGQPNVFLYHDNSGDPCGGDTVCYVDLFTDDEPDVDTEAPQLRASDDPDYDEAEQQQAERDAAFDPQTPDEVPPGTPYCVYINVANYSDELRGFIPSIVYENVSGHFPLSGKPGGSPWVWGPEYADAQRVADQFNQRIGVTRERALEIVTSSMRKSGLFGRDGE